MLNSFARTPENTKEDSFAKKLILIVSISCCLCGIIWGGLYYYFLGPGPTMVLPWLFVFIVGISIAISHKLKNERILLYALIFCIVAIPTGLQWSLGSMDDSAMVMLWCFLGPVGAIIFLDRKTAIGWWALYVVLICVSILLEPKFSDDAVNATKAYRNTFYLLNTLAPITVIFSAFLLYLSEKERAEAALIEGKVHLEQKNSQINKQNLIIEESLHQKEVLLKEIHHRVKNNLQLVSGLMQLQGSQSKDEKIKEIMDQGQNRIRSMSLIHQQLYESENLDKINFREYVKVLIQDISVMLQSEANNISIDLEAPDFHLNIDTAVPLGLILNELIMNAFKHAFSENDSGQIRVEALLNNNEFELKVIDNGKGLPEGFNMNSLNSLGVKLVKGLSRQIGGNCSFKNDNGTTATIKFKLD